MGTLLVLAVAVGVGVLVFRLTAGGEEPASTAEGSPHVQDDAVAWEGGDPGSMRGGSVAQTERGLEVPAGYIPVAPGARSWHARLGGAMGLVIAVAVGAIALALSLWALVSLVSRVVSEAGA